MPRGLREQIVRREEDAVGAQGADDVARGRRAPVRHDLRAHPVEDVGVEAHRGSMTWRSRSSDTRPSRDRADSPGGSPRSSAAVSRESWASSAASGTPSQSATAWRVEARAGQRAHDGTGVAVVADGRADRLRGRRPAHVRGDDDEQHVGAGAEPPWSPRRRRAAGRATTRRGIGHDRVEHRRDGSRGQRQRVAGVARRREHRAARARSAGPTRTCPPGTRPVIPARSGQRAPGRSSAPRARSSPPPRAIEVDEDRGVHRGVRRPGPTTPRARSPPRRPTRRRPRRRAHAPRPDAQPATSSDDQRRLVGGQLHDLLGAEVERRVPDLHGRLGAGHHRPRRRRRPSPAGTASAARSAPTRTSGALPHAAAGLGRVRRRRAGRTRRPRRGGARRRAGRGRG